MSKLSNIETELRNIAEASNVKGDNVEVLVKLLSYVYYESERASQINVLEASPSTAVNHNSLIQGAVNSMYSMYRGTNPIIKLKVISEGVSVLKKYQKVYSDKNNTLFYLGCTTRVDSEDVYMEGTYEFTPGMNATLHLLKAKDINTVDLTVDEVNPLSMDILDSDVSETYSIVRYPDGEELRSTKDFGIHVDSIKNESNKLVFDLTIPDYGLRLYSPEPRGFSTSEFYRVQYFEYTSDTVLPRDISNLKLDKFTNVFRDDQVLDVEIDQAIPKELTTNLLYNINRNLLVQSRIRSNTDIRDQFRNFFSNKILDVSQAEFNPNSSPNITLYYIPVDPGFIIEGTEEEAEFEKSLMYYVSKDIRYVPVPLNDSSNLVPVHVDVVLYIIDSIDPSEITNILLKYENKLNGKIVRDELLGELNKIKGVKYCSLKLRDDNGDEVDSISSTNSTSLDVVSNLQYMYKR